MIQLTKSQRKQWRQRLKAALQGSALDQHLLGNFYRTEYYRDGSLIHLNEAARWFHLAASQGHPASQFALAQGYLEYDGFCADESEAQMWTKKAAEQGYAEAQFELGRMLSDEDLEGAFMWTKKAAEQGHAGAQVSLSEKYLTGSGVEKNPKLALMWYTKASDQTELPPFVWLTNANAAEVAKWYEEFAREGSMTAQHMLGQHYEIGQGVDQNIKTALEWYQRAASQGNTSSYVKLGYLYEFGGGVDKDLHEAAMWHRKACARRHSSIQALDRFFVDGVGKGLKETVFWGRSRHFSNREWWRARKKRKTK